MQIVIVCIAVSVISLLISERYFKMYMILTAILLSGLYLFFEPPSAYDLYRHYQLFDNVKNLSVLDWESSIFMGKIYAQDYPVYYIYLLMISRIGIKQLLPFITGIIIYGLSFKIVYSVYISNTTRKIFQLRIAFCTIVLLSDFLSISGIRNMLAGVIFAYLLYLDFYTKINKIFCFIGYILCIFIHSMCAILLLLRLVMFIYKKFSKIVVLVVVSLIFTITNIYFNQLNSKFGNLPGISTILNVFYNYTTRENKYFVQGNFYACTALYICSFVLTLFYIWVRKKPRKGDVNISDYILLLCANAIGSFSQYEIYVRSTMILIPLLVVEIILLLKEVQPYSYRIVITESHLKGYIYVWTIPFILLLFAYYIIYQFVAKYIPTTAYYHIF